MFLMILLIFFLEFEDFRKSVKEIVPTLQFVISVDDPAQTLRTSGIVRQEITARLIGVLKEVISHFYYRKKEERKNSNDSSSNDFYFRSIYLSPGWWSRVEHDCWNKGTFSPFRERFERRVLEEIVRQENLLGPTHEIRGSGQTIRLERIIQVRN